MQPVFSFIILIFSLKDKLEKIFTFFQTLQALKRKFSSLSGNLTWPTQVDNTTTWKNQLSPFVNPFILSTFVSKRISGVNIGNIIPLPCYIGNSRRIPMKLDELLSISQTILEWWDKKYLIGPFTLAQCRSMKGIINPVFGQEKSSGKIRPVVNLSNICDSSNELSVNTSLDPTLCTVQYIKRKELVFTAQLVGTNGFCWAKDLKDGYYNVPIRQQDSHFLGITWLNQHFFFTVLPFGLSSAPALFTHFMTFVMKAIRMNNFDIAFLKIPISGIQPNTFITDSNLIISKDKLSVHVPLIKAYIDDIFGFAPSEEWALAQYQKSEAQLRCLNLMTKESKSKPPARENIILGSVFDLLKQELRAPTKKVNKYVLTMKKSIACPSLSKRDMLRDIGRVRHIGGIHKSLNAFARSLETYAHGVKELHHRISMSPQLIQDYKLCIWGLKTSEKFGVPFHFLLKPHNKPDIILYTDAALITGGIGAFVWKENGPWLAEEWSDINLFHPESRDIQWRELSAIFVIVQALKHEWKNKSITIFCDNEAIVWMLIKMRAPLYRPDLQILIREICKASIEFCFHFWINHVPGKENLIADALSRNFPDPFSLQDFPFNKGPRILIAKELLQLAATLAKPFFKLKNLIFVDI